MCKFASFVLTKSEEFWSDKSDSHEDIIQEHNLHADGIRGPNILRVEISPTNKITVWPSLKAWEYRVDQDRMPEWFDAEECEKRTRAALQRRYEKGFTTVDVSGCTALTELKADKATYVYARGCTALTELKADKATYVYANDCTALTELKADQATYVYASGCKSTLKITARKDTRIYR